MQRPVKPAHMLMQGMRLTGCAPLCRAARSDAEALRQRVGRLTLENRELRARLGEPTDGQCQSSGFRGWGQCRPATQV